MGIQLVRLSFFRKTKYKFLATIPLTIIVLDQWTKKAIIESFQLGETISVVQGFFNLTYVRNPGAAFGLFAQSHPSFRVPFFLLIPVIALFVISFIFKKIPDNSLRLSTSLSLVIGGAIGNLIDRARFSYVIDFLDFHWNYQYHFPAFNVADSAICVGVGILMLDIFFEKETEKNAPAII